MINVSKSLIIFAAFAVGSAPAYAIPGASVSYGANPVWSVGGYLSDLMTDARVIPAIGASGQDAIITDLVITGATATTGTCFASGVITIEDSTSTLAMFGMNLSTGTDRLMQEAVFIAPLGAGIRIAEGETPSLSIDWTVYSNASYCSSSLGSQIIYTLSGYYAEP